MISLVEEPLAECDVEALLRPVRTDWAALTSQIRAMEQEAGREWTERCAAQGELPLGSAAITGAGELRTEFVIHLAVGSEEENPSPRSVTEALRNALRRAEEWEINSLATPLLGVGPGCLDPETACRVMDPLVTGFAVTEPGRTVLISVEDAPSREAARARWGSGDGL